QQLVGIEEEPDRGDDANHPLNGGQRRARLGSQRRRHSSSLVCEPVSRRELWQAATACCGDRGVDRAATSVERAAEGDYTATAMSGAPSTTNGTTQTTPRPTVDGKNTAATSAARAA